MNDLLHSPLALRLTAGFALGLLVGACYLALLWRAVQASLRTAQGAPLALAALRLALAWAGFMVAAQAGAPGLVSALAGFLTARTLVLRRARQELA